MAGAGKGNYGLILIAALNMVISLYYYLCVVKAIFMDNNDLPIENLKISFFPKIAMIACLSGILLIGPMGWIYDYIYSLSSNF